MLVAPAHWGGDSHRAQLLTVVRELARRGHAVTYVTSQLEREEDRADVASSGVEVIAPEGIAWPADLDLSLAVRMARGETELEARRVLVKAASEAAVSFFAAERVRALCSRQFDVGLVDADSLTGHLLIDALYPLPHAHFLTYPYRRPATLSLKTQMLDTATLQRESGHVLERLRARLGAPPKAQCAACHVLTIIGHSRALHASANQPMPEVLSQTTSSRKEQLNASLLVAGPPALYCTGSVLARPSSGEAALSGAFAELADGARGGFVVVALGSWGDRACTQLGKDEAVLAALSQLGCPCIWKTASAPQHVRGAAVNVHVATWLPQRALLAHPHCRLLVCHGGANSVSEALGCGVPVVALPIAWDQPVNAALLEDLEVGRSLPLATLAASSLLDAMRAVLADGALAERARTLAVEMGLLDSKAAGAADLVERVACTFDAEMREAAAHGIGAATVPDSTSSDDDASVDEAVAGWGDGLD